MRTDSIIEVTLPRGQVFLESDDVDVFRNVLENRFSHSFLVNHEKISLDKRIGSIETVDRLRELRSYRTGLFLECA